MIEINQINQSINRSWRSIRLMFPVTTKGFPLSGSQRAEVDRPPGRRYLASRGASAPRRSISARWRWGGEDVAACLLFLPLVVVPSSNIRRRRASLNVLQKLPSNRFTTLKWNRWVWFLFAPPPTWDPPIMTPKHDPGVGHPSVSYIPSHLGPFRRNISCWFCVHKTQDRNVCWLKQSDLKINLIWNRIFIMTSMKQEISNSFNILCFCSWKL